MLNSIRLFLLALVVCVLSGCGGGEAVEASNAAASNEPTAANSAKPAKEAPAAPNKKKKKFPRDGDDEDQEEDDRVTAVTPQVPANAPGATGSSQGKGKGTFFGFTIPGLSALTGGAPTDLPNSLDSWTDGHFVLAVRRRNDRLPEAISIRAKSDLHRPTFVSLSKQLLQTAIEAPEVVKAAPSPTPKPSGGRRRGGRKSRRDDDDSGPEGGRKSRRDDDDSSPEGRRTSGRDRDGGLGRLRGIKLPQPSAVAPVVAPNQPVSTAPIPVIGTLTQRQIVQAVVRGLLVNDSPEAWGTLQAVLSHQQQTPLDLKQASIVVFEEVFGSEQINVAMAENLAVFVLNSQDQMQVGMNLLASLASQVSRMHLHLAGVSPNSPEGPQGLGQTPAIGVLRMGLSLGERRRRRDEDEDEDDRGERRRPKNAAAGPPAVAIELPPLNLSPEALEASAVVLHGSTFLDTVKESLENTTDLSSGKSTLLLASMLPDVKLRHAMYDVLMDKHRLGADILLGGGFYGPLVRDPVHLLVLKSLPRQRKGRDGSAQRDESGDAGITWAKATWEMVRSVRDQLSQASDDPELAWDERVPLRLHRGAVPDVSIQLTIEDGSVSGEEASAGTQVFYSRCSVMPADDREMKQLAAHYETQTKGIRRELRDEGILWFDGIRAGSDGTRMTMDVLISKAAASVVARGFGGAGRSRGRGDSGPGQRFTVETITIVAADPRVSQEPEKPAETETE